MARVNKRKVAYQDVSSSVCYELQGITPQEIRDYRVRNNLSRSAMSIRCHIPETTIASWEKGVRKPSAPAVFMLRQLLAA